MEILSSWFNLRKYGYLHIISFSRCFLFYNYTLYYFSHCHIYNRRTPADKNPAKCKKNKSKCKIISNFY